MQAQRKNTACWFQRDSLDFLRFVLGMRHDYPRDGPISFPFLLGGAGGGWIQFVFRVLGGWDDIGI